MSQGWFPVGNPSIGIHDAMRVKPTLQWGTKDNGYAKNIRCLPRKVAGTRWRWPIQDNKGVAYVLQSTRLLRKGLPCFLKPAS